jgi:spore coat polysaccharide biosynthesis protein SpsF
MKVVAIIQARMSSTRLPGKALLDLAGEPMLGRVINRLSRAQLVDDLVVATSIEAIDDVIEKFCHSRHVDCLRGSADDVLDRYYRAATARAAEVVVRITSDCPLIDPELVDRVIKAFLVCDPPVDYACNVEPNRTFPRGLDTEVMSIEALERVWREDKNPQWREHVTAYIRRNPQDFRIHCVTNDQDLSDMRWCIDTSEDIQFVTRLFDHFGDDQFSWRQALDVLSSEPDWLTVNRHVTQKAF